MRFRFEKKTSLGRSCNRWRFLRLNNFTYTLGEGKAILNLAGHIGFLHTRRPRERGGTTPLTVSPLHAPGTASVAKDPAPGAAVTAAEVTRATGTSQVTSASTDPEVTSTASGSPEPWRPLPASASIPAPSGLSVPAASAGVPTPSDISAPTAIVAPAC